jgi:hypothetical protein
MTDEQRLDRMERIVRLLIKAGLRARQQTREQAREQNEKINILIDSQIRYEERVRQNEDGIKDYSEWAKQHGERLAVLEARAIEMAARADERFAAMAVAQENTEKQLQSLAATVERVINERMNGQP